MPTNKETLRALRNLANKLEELGVKSEELKILKWHIGQQSRQIGWEYDEKTKRWVYGRTREYGKHRK